MLLADFDYDLPPDLIAQEPILERTSSRLLAVDRQSCRLSHYRFSGIINLLPPDCLLVLNDARVFPARLRGHKESGGRLEFLLLRRLPGPDETWEVMCNLQEKLFHGQSSLPLELFSYFISPSTLFM